MTAARSAVTLCALLSFSMTGPAVAVADPAPVPPTSSATVPAPPASIDSGAEPTTSSTIAPNSPTTTMSPTTSVPLPGAPGTTIPASTSPSSTTSTTLGATQLAALIQGLGTEVARAQAVSDYLAARALASSLGSGQPLTSSADPVLYAAAVAQLQATEDLAAAQQRFAEARHRIGQVAVALYLGEQVPPDGMALTGTVGDRTDVLAGILGTAQLQAKAAKAELNRDTAAAYKRRQEADRLVQARTVQLQAIALQNEAAAGSQALAAPPGVGALPTRLVQQSPTILGRSVLSVDEIVGWFEASGHNPNLTVPVAALAADFLSAGGAAGVRADIAFAQSVLETGYFRFPGFGQVTPSDNNFAGIGACDSCASGFHFPDALTGVNAQMQLLHAYATTSQPNPGPLPGPFSVSGCCPTWMELTGVWATAPDYGFKILKLYRTMVQWALARRSAAAQL